VQHGHNLRKKEGERKKKKGREKGFGLICASAGSRGGASERGEEDYQGLLNVSALGQSQGTKKKKKRGRGGTSRSTITV